LITGNRYWVNKGIYEKCFYREVVSHVHGSGLAKRKIMNIQVSSQSAKKIFDQLTIS
jgi:hypothetical protein